MFFRYLATGNSFKSLHFSTRMGTTTISFIVKETCQAIWDVLAPEFLPHPTEDGWKAIAEKFMRKTQFPNCLGAVDGKHVHIKAPPRSGSLFRNYKHGFSIILMAIADADCKFVLVDVGHLGANSDGGIWKHGEMGQRVKNNDLGFPKPAPIEGYEHAGDFPFVLVGDEAFSLHDNMMRPYAGRRDCVNLMPKDESIFNYRLSRARRVVENAFGLLAMRWQIFTRPMNIHPENATLVVQACLALHNAFHEPGTTVGSMRARLHTNTAVPHLPGLTRFGGNAKDRYKAIRDAFKDYFLSPAGRTGFDDEYQLLQ